MAQQIYTNFPLDPTIWLVCPPLRIRANDGQSLECSQEGIWWWGIVPAPGPESGLSGNAREH